MSIAASAAAADYQRDLGDGLILRWSTQEDTTKISELVGNVFRQGQNDEPNMSLQARVEQLMSGNHPLMSPTDYGVIEDTSREGKPLVACTCLWQHEWAYEGIPFSVGRPEIVASDPTYRKRGLIRALFAMVHARSAARGDLVQAITGIPYFYRQFGYEYALDLGGERTTYISAIPALKEGENESYTFREATLEDIPLIIGYYNLPRANSMVWTTIPENYWRYEVWEAWQNKPEKYHTIRTLMIVDAQGTPVGYAMLDNLRRGRGMFVFAFEVSKGVNLQAVMPSALRGLAKVGEQIPRRKADTPALSEIIFALGRKHPVYDVLGDEMAHEKEPPYAWYVRVADLPEFLKHISPILEKRLAASYLNNYTGELKLDFYRGGLRMVFAEGKLTTVENWPVPVYNSNAGAGFPPLLFLKTLFGYSSLDTLRAAFPDVWFNAETKALLNILFPTRYSFVAPL